MSSIYPDQIQITPIILDPEFGNDTIGTSFLSTARVVYDNKLMYMANGKSIKPQTKILLPKDTSIKEGYKVAIKKLGEKSITDSRSNSFEVIQVNEVVGLSSVHHIEVII